MDSKSPDGYVDIEPACGQQRPGRSLGFERQVSDSIDGDLTGLVFKRHATDDVSTASSSDSTGMRRELENNIMVMLRSVLHSQAEPDMGKGQLNLSQSPTKLLHPSFFEGGMSLRAPQVTAPTWSRNDACDKYVPAKKPLVVPPGSRCMPLADEKHPCLLSGQTTVMIKHVPVAYTQRKLLREITNAGFQGLLDFIYLPMDARSRSNRGFAFCNFLDGPTAAKFYDKFHGSRLQCSGDTPALEIAAAEIQGFEENAKHFLIEKAAAKGRESHSRPIFLRSLPAHLKHQLAGSGAAKVRAQVEVAKPHKPAADRSNPLPLRPLPAGEVATPHSYQESSVHLPSSFAAPQRRRTSQSHQANLCNSCGQAWEQHFSFCPYCGAARSSRSQLEVTSIQI